MRQLAMQHPVAVREDWETPPEFFAKYDREFGFTLDVCATEANTKCRLYIDPEQDGLAQPWEGATCWMNPPFGRQIPRWMAKAWAESQRGATVVCLVPSRTDTRWWHSYAERGERRFIKGRIRFVGAKHNAPFPCAVVVFRPGVAAQDEGARMGGLHGVGNPDAARDHSALTLPAFPCPSLCARCGRDLADCACDAGPHRFGSFAQ